MPSPVDRPLAGKSGTRQFADRFKVWNRKLHYYLGLYFLFFLWMFALSGLLLNHGGWSFAQFFPNRKVTILERAVQPPAPASDLDQARDLMRQSGIQGEISWNAARAEPARLDFNVNRPGQIYRIQADFARGRAKIEHTEYNGWGILLFSSSAGNVFTGNDFINNDYPVALDMRRTDNHFDDGTHGNYWSDAAAFELQGARVSCGGGTSADRRS